MIYHKPSNEKEAVDILVAEKGVARVLAGGTDILVQMRSGVIKPNLIVDIKSLPGMRSIIRSSDGYEIGAAVSGFDFNLCCATTFACLVGRSFMFSFLKCFRSTGIAWPDRGLTLYKWPSSRTSSTVACPPHD